MSQSYIVSFEITIDLKWVTIILTERGITLINMNQNNVLYYHPDDSLKNHVMDAMETVTRQFTVAITLISIQCCASKLFFILIC